MNVSYEKNKDLIIVINEFVVCINVELTAFQCFLLSFLKRNIVRTWIIEVTVKNTKFLQLT